MSDLAAFLLARIAEDEHRALGRRDHNAPSARVYALAECEAKRRIVALHSETSEMRDYGNWEPHLCRSCGGQGYNDFDGIAYPCDTIKALASVYADHPDFREEWRA